MTAATEPLSDSFGYGLAADRPAAGINGRAYYSYDTEAYERDNGTTWDVISIGNTGGGSSEVADADDNPDVTDVEEIEFVFDGVVAGGTSFPASPTLYQPFFRTDRGLEYYWDGTRWLTKNEYAQTLSVSDVLLPHSATDSKLYGAVDLGANGAWVARLAIATLGISISGSAYFTYQLNKRDLDGTETAVGGSFSTNADTTGKWVRHDVTIGASVTTGLTWALKATKVGSPTGGYEVATVYYRLIG